MATRREKLASKRATSFAARSHPEPEERDTFIADSLEADYPPDYEGPPPVGGEPDPDLPYVGTREGEAVGGASAPALREVAADDAATFVRASERARAHVRGAPPSERAKPFEGPAWISTIATIGAPTRVLVGKAAPLEGAYAAVEVASVITSHDAWTFAPDPGYPPDVQERDYKRDPYEQMKVATNAARLVPAYLVTDNPDSTNGPPVVTWRTDGAQLFALGGNSRCMTLARAYKQGGAKEYRAALVERAKVFGLTPTAFDGMKAPALVRIVRADAGAWRELSRALNESQTQDKSESVDAVSLSHRLSDGTLRLLGDAVDDDETLGAFLASTRARGVVAGLWRDGVITQQTGGRYLAGSDLTEAGRDLIVRVIVAKLVPDAVQLDAMGPARRDTIARAAPALLMARSAGHDVSEPLGAALSDLIDAQARGVTLASLEAQGSMFALTATRARSREAIALRSLLDGPARRCVRALRVFGRLAIESPAAQGGLPGLDTPRDTAALLDAAIAAST